MTKNSASKLTVRAADGVFREFMKELGIHPAEDATKAPADPDMDWFRWLIRYWGRRGRGNQLYKSGAAESVG